MLCGKATCRNVNAWANSGQDHVGWRFEENIADEEDKENDGVVGAAHVELVAHAALDKESQRFPVFSLSTWV